MTLPCISIFASLVFLIIADGVAAGVEVQDVRNVGFMPAPQKPGEIQHIKWANGTVVDPYAVQIGLPPSLTQVVTKYCEDFGITELYKTLFSDQSNELKPGTDRILNFDNVEWYLQRPESKWKSNMHWLNCNDESSHDRYLALLGEGGFDIVLDALGNFFDLDGIDIYSAGFIGITHCEQGYVHHDFTGADGKAFNVLIPLELVPGSPPEFLVQRHEDGQIVRVHYEHSVALAVGDDTQHATADCDYREQPGKMRMAMSIYLADINESNVDAIIGDYTDPFPPAEPEYLLNHRGRHWKKDGSVRLPKECKNPLAEDIVKESSEPKGKIYASAAEEANADDEDEDEDESDQHHEEEVEADKHWSEFNRNDFWYAFDCPEVFETDRPVPTDATWEYLRRKYRAIVGPDQSSIPAEAASQTGGFKVQVEARQTKDKGRGVFATERIPKGSLVWNTQFTARFPDAMSYRRLVMAISPDLACEAMPWSYIQAVPFVNEDVEEEESLQISMDMDIGALINSGSLYSDDGSFDDENFKYKGKIPSRWKGYANVGCLPNDLPGGCTDNYFALRDIYPDEELFVFYGDFALPDEWWEIGLECTVCEVTFAE